MNRATWTSVLDRQIEATIQGIKSRVVVFSGKGGVGKTTVAVNLAYALSRGGKPVGLLDSCGGVDWGSLDFLVIDLPPGTGDEVLTITQRTSPQVAVVVTTHPMDL